MGIRGERELSTRVASTVASAGAAVALLVGASAASAATTIGQFATLANPPTAVCASNDRDLLQHTVSSGDAYIVPPYGATITSWSHLAAAGAGQTLTFKVYRKVAEPNTYRVIGADGPRPLDAGVVNNFPVNIAVQGGDVIGLNTANAGTVNNACSEAIGAGDSMRFRSPGLAVGQQNTYNDQPNSRLNVKAVVEPSNVITLGALTRNVNKGTANLLVTVPGPGELSLAGTKVTTANTALGGPVDVTLKIKAAGKAKKKLRKTGKVKASVDVSYTPTNGTLAVINLPVKLKKQLPPN